MLANDIILSIGTNILGPILVYMKIRDERNTTKRKRDEHEMSVKSQADKCIEENQLMQYRVALLEEKVKEISQLKELMYDIKLTLAELRPIITILHKRMEEG